MTPDALMSGGFLAVAAYAAIALGRLAPSLVKLAAAATAWLAGQEELRVATLSEYKASAKRHGEILAALGARAA